MSGFVAWQLGEELIHWVQHLEYYQDMMNAQYKNFEFEAKVFYDMAHASSESDYPFTFLGVYGYEPDHPFYNEYAEWIYNMVDRGRFDDGKFYDMCEKFRGAPEGTIVNRNIRPLLVLDFMKKLFK